MPCQLPAAESIAADVRRALAEDVGSGDLTAALIPLSRQVHARVISREEAILCGKAWFDQSFLQLDAGIRIDWMARDGAHLRPGQTLCELHGPARKLLTGERTALNFLQTLSGTATMTYRYAEAMGTPNVRLLDTRKTLPGLRLAQKYAVCCGGGKNHRMGLYDAFLIKENHIAAAGSIDAAVRQARQLSSPHTPVEVEVETLDELDTAIAAGADILLLDNMTTEQLRQAVTRVAGRVKLEASGNITLDNIHTVAATGVDYVSTGAITKHLVAIDLSMRFLPD